jgi:dTDP-4-dehydrorhamnose reductase
MKDRFLVIGADGLIGSTLKDHWRTAGHEVIATCLQENDAAAGMVHLDLSEPSSLWPELPHCRFAVLCAAITSLDECRRDPKRTSFINVAQTLEMAHRLLDQHCFVLFISSNLVFDGITPMKKPQDPVCPRTEYGHQKASAEKGLLEMSGNVGIVRLTKVVHRNWPLVGNWVTSLRAGETITPFVDSVMAPITLASTVRAIAAVAENQLAEIWHLSASDDISYANLAQNIVRKLDLNPDLVHPVPANTAINPEHIAQHTTLDARRSVEKLGFKVQGAWRNIEETFFMEEGPGNAV